MSSRAALSLLAALLLAPLSAAHACVCSAGSTRSALERADAVFLGRPVGFRPSLLQPFSVEVTRFAVERVWKGEAAREVTLAIRFREDCSGDFPDDGTRWLVFAVHDAWGRLTTHTCSGTRPWFDAAGEELIPGAQVLADLGPGRPPLPEPAHDPWPLVGWGILALGALGAWWARRRRSSAPVSRS